MTQILFISIIILHILQYSSDAYRNLCKMGFEIMEYLKKKFYRDVIYSHHIATKSGKFQVGTLRTYVPGACTGAMFSRQTAGLFYAVQEQVNACCSAFEDSPSTQQQSSFSEV